ncbi:MAG: hypothetical protein K8S98_03625 [Planctomycetes bacterium]|nr:hypothetical protein [Planctomycetota bacterium]
MVVLALLALVAAVFSLARMLANLAALAVVLELWRAWLALLAFACLATAALAWTATRRPIAFRPALRLAVVAAVAGWLAFLAFAQPYQGLWLELALGPIAGAWSLLVLALSRARLGRAANFAERALFALALAAPLLEVGLRVVARVHPTPLFARAGDTERAVIERFRCAPGTPRFGFPCNSRGFYDEEFHRKRAGERLIAAVGDSFLVGAVPHARSFTAVCERELGATVAAIGVAGSGPREYARLVLDEALPLDPDVVVVGLFVGNDFDIEVPDLEREASVLYDVFARERVMLFTVTERVVRLRRESARANQVARNAGEVQGERAPRVDEARLDETFPWLADPAREEPTLSPEVFARLESERAALVCRGEPPSLATVEDALLRVRDACAGRDFVVVLIPDEFQVEDDVWRAATAKAREPLDRNRMQRVLAAFLERERIPHLDLLPALRAAPPLADGRRHVYHLRDTHFNARGNAIAGHELAQFLAARISR